MIIDVYTHTGTKKGTADLPKEFFESTINTGLMHQAVVRVQGNKRSAVAHAKTRGETKGSTRKLFSQKGTGRARRGPVRSPLLRGGGKAFGPRSDANFYKNMPKKMRRIALKSSLSLHAKNGSIIGLEKYPETIKTKDLANMMEKLPVEMGRKILFVTSDKHDALSLSVRNIPNARSVQVRFLNCEDVLGSRHIVFLVDALKKLEEVFGEKDKGDRTKDKGDRTKDKEEKKETNEEKEKNQKSSKSTSSTKTK